MIETILGALLIMVMRITDVTIGTFRTILVVQGKKYYAAIAGFFEVLIWITAMKFIVGNLDNNLNLLAYAIGFAIGNILGITTEEKIGLGYVQINVISRYAADKIADSLRVSKYGVTLLPAEGGSGGMAIIVAIVRRRDTRNVVKIIDGIDPKAFITFQHSRPYRGYIHGSRK
ncbi:MAG: hypothetical protein CVV23_15910 [Ignavibacteriae bacterium HGW-Ignavibacteriae-2]|jgi:uncharacterized protein YebE (UPF0316 family)|nr:DUF2179 domain-containing protein [Bacteroidota bacterium]PKL87333.1 MAG: hypothetical protein CVV23_15910 [Ignavibacteriae bacterium HGW-Ignavibacteriae-2]